MTELSGEPLGPERDRGPEVRLFNVDALRDEEFVILYRGIGYMATSGEDEISLDGHHIEYASHVADPLWDRLIADVRDLALRDPERVKGFVQRCLESSQEIDHEFAANVIPGLLDYDYVFTRDTLIDMAKGYRGHSDNKPSDGPVYVEGASTAARNEIAILMRDRLTPEQAADFQARGEPTWPFEPAPPSEIYP